MDPIETLSDGSATSIPYEFRAAGDCLIRAEYNGDSNYPAVTSPTTSLTITPTLDHFTLHVCSPQFAGIGFSVFITARDHSGNLLTSYNGLNTLTVSAGTINPSTISLTDGVWFGFVTVTQAGFSISISTSGGGKTGTSNTFTVNPLI
jgi:hypothetical protein